MNWQDPIPAAQQASSLATSQPLSDACAAVRQHFDAYLDGALTGLERNALAAHLEDCTACALDFNELRTLSATLNGLGPAPAPAVLQTQLLEAIAVERAAGSHLPFGRRMLLALRETIAPMALRLSLSAGVAAVLIGGLVWMYAPTLAVQANDEAMAHIVAPRYMYSEVPPVAVDTPRGALVIDAKVNAEGRVYDFAILNGPQDPDIKVRVEENLLVSVFRPATVFGVPVNGHVLVTYTGVLVRG